jgi:hypothetical protein
MPFPLFFPIAITISKKLKSRFAASYLNPGEIAESIHGEVFILGISRSIASAYINNDQLDSAQTGTIRFPVHIFRSKKGTYCHACTKLTVINLFGKMRTMKAGFHR